MLGTDHRDDEHELGAREASVQHLLTDVSEAERTQALARFHILRPCLEDGVPLARLSRESLVIGAI